ncbi:IS3 family transposase [Myroides sp. LJL119]
MCGINRQVYYRDINRTEQSKTTASTVVDLVQEVRMVMPRLGTRKLYYLLQEKLGAIKIGRDKLFAILKANNLLIKQKKKYHITTDSDHPFFKYPNITTDLSINGPNQLWVSDITYIGTRKQPCYLSLITDVYSKKIVGYNVSNSLSLEGASNALKFAIKDNKATIKGLIHHSDRGLQYCSKYYQKILRRHEIKCSMTNNGDPYENSIAERINGILKQEFIIDRYNKDLAIMKKIIKEVVYTYNNYRPHSSNYMLTPNQMFVTKNRVFKGYKKIVAN